MSPMITTLRRRARRAHRMERVLSRLHGAALVIVFLLLFAICGGMEHRDYLAVTADAVTTTPERR